MRWLGWSHPGPINTLAGIRRYLVCLGGTAGFGIVDTVRQSDPYLSHGSDRRSSCGGSVSTGHQRALHGIIAGREYGEWVRPVDTCLVLGEELLSRRRRPMSCNDLNSICHRLPTCDSWSVVPYPARSFASCPGKCNASASL